MWRGIERSGRFLLVDRCSFGDTNKYVSLVFDGHGRRGNHCVPETYSFSRWCRHGVELKPWQKGSKVVLCGQTETYSPIWPTLDEWYQEATKGKARFHLTHFRPHPAGDNPTGLPEWRTWEDVGVAVTLNSSVAVDALVNGVNAIVYDEGGMAHGWRWRFGDKEMRREPFFRWLAWTQWSHEEIREGHPIKHILDHAAA